MKIMKTVIYWLWLIILPVALSPTLGFVYVAMNAGVGIFDSPMTIFHKVMLCIIVLLIALMLILYLNILLKDFRRQCDIPEHVVFEAFDKMPFIVLGVFVFSVNNIYHPAWLQPILLFSPLISGIVSGIFYLFVNQHVIPKLASILELKKEE